MVGLDKKLLARYGKDADKLAGIIPFSGQVITHFETRNQRGLKPLQPTIDETAPLYHVRNDCAPILILSGDREKELYGRYEESAYFYRLFKLLGHPDVTLYELGGFDHGSMCAAAFPLAVRFIRIFSAAEMGYQLAFQRLEILVGNFIEQVADSPCDMYLLCRLEIGALAAILWNTQWIDDADGRVLGGIAKGG